MDPGIDFSVQPTRGSRIRTTLSYGEPNYTDCVRERGRENLNDSVVGSRGVETSGEPEKFTHLGIFHKINCKIATAVALKILGRKNMLIIFLDELFRLVFLSFYAPGGLSGGLCRCSVDVGTKFRVKHL